MSSITSFTAIGLASLFAGGLFVADRPGRPQGGRAPVLSVRADKICESNGPITIVDIDAGMYLGATSPGCQLTWSVEGDGSVSITQASDRGVRLEFDMRTTWETACTLALVARNEFGTSRTSTRLIVRDTMPPELTVPPDAFAIDDAAADPSRTGYATASDLRSQDVRITYFDDTSDPDFTVRIWHAFDGRYTSSGAQTLTRSDFSPPSAHLDIFPGKCPNSLKVSKHHGDDGDDDDGDDDDGDDDDGDDDDGDHGHGHGHDYDLGLAAPSVSTSLLGNAFDVTLVDLSSIRFVRVFDNLTSGGLTTVVVFPTQFNFEDNGTPFEGAMCGCNALGDDGKLDLKVKFDMEEVIKAFGLDKEPNGTMVPLEIRGHFYNDVRPFRARDCVKIINHHHDDDDD